MSSDVPVFVICRDRLSCLESLVAWLENAQHQLIVLVDNDSSYPPLLDYYRSTPHPVVRLASNVGHLAPWDARVIERFAAGRPYIVTDPDVLPTEECPQDAALVLLELLERYPSYCKAGLGLKIDDLPEHYSLATYVRRWEAQHWKVEVEKGVFEANVDTTFAAYRQGSAFAKKPALRTAGPYLARHAPWYIDSRNLSDEERYYRAHASRTINSWNQEELPPKLDGYFHRGPWHRIRRRIRAIRSE